MKCFVMAALLLLPGYAFAQNKPAKTTAAAPAISYKIIPAEGGGWGYDIYQQGKLTIHQPSIPGQAGNRGFASKAAAEKVARLVMGKLQRGEMPPTVTQEEMKEIKVL